MKIFLSVIIFTLVISRAFAQPYKTIKTYKTYNWMVGISWSAIDDDGRPFNALFNLPNWNYEMYPTRLSLDKYFKYGWSLEGVATYTNYLGGKLVNGKLEASGAFFSFDVNGKYSFYNQYAPKARWIDPYFTFGLGYTYRSNAFTENHIPNLNLGFGINFWIAKGFGIQIHSNAKFGVYPRFWNTNTNYLQHSIGIVYRWGEGSIKNSPKEKKQYKWTKDKQRHKTKTGH